MLKVKHQMKLVFFQMKLVFFSLRKIFLVKVEGIRFHKVILIRVQKSSTYTTEESQRDHTECLVIFQVTKRKV